MTGALAVGVGFRRICTARALVELARQALIRAAPLHPGRPTVLATIADKDGEVLHDAAAELGLAVLVLSRAALEGAQDRITVASETARVRFGISSVAEAAALAAAGPGSRLVVTRMASPDATCAIAAPEEPA